MMNLFKAKLSIKTLKEELAEQNLLEDWHLERGRYHNQQYVEAGKQRAKLRTQIQVAERKYLDSALGKD